MRNFIEKYPDVKFISGAWEDISSILEKNSVDMIYIHYMHPHPEEDGKYEHNQEGFMKKVQIEMNNVLKPMGIFVNHSIESDFILDTAEFKSMNYTEIRVGLPRINSEDDSIGPEIKKKFVGRYEKGYSFGKALIVNQKPKI